MIVKLRGPGRASLLHNLTQVHDLDVARRVGGAGAFVLHSRSKNISRLIQELSARSDVAYAEPNFVVHADALPNDSSLGELWGLRNSGQTILGVPGTAGADISASAAWEISTGSAVNVVAVVDSGIDYTHPDLATTSNGGNEPRGDVHTNGMESGWSLFRRSIVGAYPHLSEKHLPAYLDEAAFRFNNR